MALVLCPLSELTSREWTARVSSPRLPLRISVFHMPQETNSRRNDLKQIVEKQKVGKKKKKLYILFIIEANRQRVTTCSFIYP